MRVKAQRLAGFAVALLIMVAVWCLWNESFALRRIVEGILFGSISLVLTSRVALKAFYPATYAVSPVRILRYIAIVFVQIYVSGFDAIRLTLTGRLNVGIVDVPTKLTNPFEGVLVANAITLTPGTVTIDYDRDNMKIVWINCDTNDPEAAGERIKGSFERVFLRASGGSEPEMQPSVEGAEDE